MSDFEAARSLDIDADPCTAIVHVPRSYAHEEDVWERAAAIAINDPGTEKIKWLCWAVMGIQDEGFWRAGSAEFGSKDPKPRDPKVSRRYYETWKAKKAGIRTHTFGK